MKSRLRLKVCEARYREGGILKIKSRLRLKVCEATLCLASQRCYPESKNVPDISGHLEKPLTDSRSD